jgi:hypothetical protein
VSRGAKIALTAVGLVIALNLALALVRSVTGGTPGGRASSSYSTGAEGVAAYASLLSRSGHRISRLRSLPSDTRLDPEQTVILLAPAEPVAEADADALRAFVEGGGRLVVGGPAGRWLRRIVGNAPTWSPSRVRAPHIVAPSAETARVATLRTDDEGSWAGGGALPLLGDRDGSLLSLVLVGEGRVLLLATASPLQNALLAKADNAALSLALAGPGARPVTFLEAYHGYGAATTGFEAIPGEWMVGFVLLVLAALTMMAAGGRRFGPPEARERELPPPRREYVESLGGILARSRSRDAATQPGRARIERLVSARARLGQTPTADELRAAAIGLGVAEGEADVLARPAVTDADVLALGRLHARLERESPS